MLKVKYTGSKKSFPVMLPAGVKSRGSIKETKMVTAGEEFEVSEADAHKLVKIDPAHFAYVDPSVVPPSEESSPVGSASDASVPSGEMSSSPSEYEEYTPDSKNKKGKKK